MMNINKKTIFFSRAATLLLLASVMFGSMWQSQYTISPLEWGLMISNAKDLSLGLKPYQEIFIQYGFLTTLVQRFAYTTFGHNLLSIMLVTTVAYTLGLYILYGISQKCNFTQPQSIILILICVLIHPIVIYPWSNYIAFPMLMLGITNILTSRAHKANTFLSGIFFGLAILAREGLAPAVLFFMLSSFFFDFLGNKSISTSSKIFFQNLIGVLIPISIFLCYLFYTDLISYWIKLAVSVPRIYSEVMFPHMREINIHQPFSAIKLLGPFVYKTYQSIFECEPRWILFIIIFIINSLVLIKGIINSNYRNQNLNKIKIALISLLLISSALHIPEIFRLATGSVVGIINLPILYNTNKYKFFNLCLILILFLTCLPKSGGSDFLTTNYFFPDPLTRSTSSLVLTPRYFKGQRWPIEVSEFYKNIELDLAVISQKCQNIQYHHNDTHDTFFQIISPFKQYQMAPFWFFPEMNALRPELNLQTKLTAYDDLVLIKSSYIAGKYAEIHVPTNFYIYKSYNYPLPHLPSQRIFLILPTNCLP